MDTVSGVQPVIDAAHFEMHRQYGFVTTLVDTSMANTEYIGLAFTTPAAPKHVHMMTAFATKAGASLQIIEGPTLSGGTAATAYNRWRDSTNAAAITNFKKYDSAGGDSISGGTVIWDRYAWSDKKSTGVLDRNSDELVLKAATVYAIKLTALADTNAGHIEMNWYEYNDVL